LLVSAQTDAVDDYIKSEMQKRRIPGLALAVVKEGKLVMAKGYGVASLEHEVPVTPQTVFAIASLDKQLTAMAVMMLVEEGKIGLDDHITKYFETPPDTWKNIEVRHLLTHTAGLQDDFIERVNGRIFERYTNKQLFENATKLPVDFLPGEKFQYSDQGFFLLQLIVEKASGLPYRKFLSERICKPLEMTATYYLDQHEIIKNRATAYELDPDGRLRPERWRLIEFDLYNDVGSTVLDFAKWDAALYTEKLLKKSGRDRMWTPAKLNDGNTAYFNSLFRSNYSYGFAWMLGDFQGHRIIKHSGFTGVCIFRLPDDKTTVIVFTNLTMPSGSGPEGLALGIAGMYVPEVSWLAMKEKPDPEPQITRKLKDELLRLGKGQPDSSLYTPAFHLIVRAEAPAFQSHLKRLGALESLTFLDEESREGKRLLYYRAGYENGRLFLRITLNKEGLIERLQGDRV
jgi:CubicO group peptidase (beta-lactamase class C family)